MGWTEADIPDLAGATAVVTGASGGLGWETARALAAAGAHVVLAARGTERLASAEEGIRGAVPSASLETVALDLASLASVQDAAERILSRHDRLDILVNNAGVMAIPYSLTEDGFETQLAVNHLGHHALTARLLPALLAAPAARVVGVTSTARHFGRPVDPSDPQMTVGYEPWAAYARSKLANVHFTVGLQDRFTRAGVAARALVAHPGLSGTGLQTASVAASGGGRPQRFWEFMARHTGMRPARGALPQLRAATDPDARPDALHAPRWVNFGAPVERRLSRGERDPAAIATLFAVSEEATGLVLDPAAARGGTVRP